MPDTLAMQLIDAVLMKNTGEVLALLGKGAPVDARDPEHQETPLMLCAYRGPRELAEVLLSAGADVHATNDKDQTPLMYAANAGQEGILRLLLEQGADINARDYLGETALVQAIFFAHFGSVEILLDAGADVDLPDEDGTTPLGHATSHGFVNLVPLLRARTARR